MCLAIAKTAKGKISFEQLSNGYDNNSDGAGFAYAHNGQLRIVKGFFKFKSFYQAYLRYSHLPMVIHFRLATHGAKNKCNCHPWAVQGGKYALVHNGILNIKCENKKLSDTGNFVQLVLEPMLAVGVKPSMPAFKFLLAQAIGSFNKFAILDGRGEFTIINEKEGHWENGAWFSNRSHETWYQRYTEMQMGNVGYHAAWSGETDPAVKRYVNAGSYVGTEKPAAKTADVIGIGSLPTTDAPKPLVEKEPASAGLAQSLLSSDEQLAIAEARANKAGQTVEQRPQLDTARLMEMGIANPEDGLLPGSFDPETEAEINCVMHDTNCTRYEALRTLLLA